MTGSNFNNSIDASRVARVVTFFEHLTHERVDELHELYATDAHFKDPFNDVRGIHDICGVFHHMFANLDDPRFIVTHRVTEGLHCFLTWDFVFAFQSFKKGQIQTVRGSTHLMFNHQGMVASHRDYWDTGEELYEKIPLLSAFMRWIKARVNSA